MLLLDTSAVSSLMHRSRTALERLRDEDPSSVYLCTPVAAEIEFGLSLLETASRRRALLDREYRRLRLAVRFTDWTESAAAEFGFWKARLRERGKPIDDMDLIIASIALSLRARLATTNTRHFARIEGLSIVDWSRQDRGRR
jgi:predicted nucleic acid-binding protein